jgi:uncharacterized Fe-S cluster-containing radical SAM superfamily enzyme
MMLFKVTRESGIPLIGCVYFGIIDRGSNLLQVRPSCSCNLNCPFCSVDAGPCSKTRATNFEVELNYLVDEVKKVAEFKGEDVECHIDSPGEPMLYPEIVELVAALKKIPEVSVVSMQSNGTLLNPEVIKKLEAAGLDRINLSMHALEPELAKKLAGLDWYDIEKIKEVARLIAKSRIDLLIAPVYMPNVNDAEIPKLIRFAKDIGAGKKWPMIGIQKFEKYRLGRNMKGIRLQNWWRFYNRSIKLWEKEFGMKLILSPKDFGIDKQQMLPVVMEKGEKVNVVLAAQGWLNNEMLGFAKGRVVSVLNCLKRDGNLKVKIVSNKHNIYLAEIV